MWLKVRRLINLLLQVLYSPASVYILPKEFCRLNGYLALDTKYLITSLLMRLSIRLCLGDLPAICAEVFSSDRLVAYSGMRVDNSQIYL